jgi:hypothetical protein
MIPDYLQSSVYSAVRVAQEESGRKGSEIVDGALNLVRVELVAAVGHKAAAHLLRALADSIAGELDDSA